MLYYYKRPHGFFSLFVIQAAGSPGANRPSRPPSGHFPGNGIGSGNRPNYPGTDYRPAYPNYPSYPSYPDFPEGSDDESDYEQYYTGPGGYYPGNYYLSHPAYQRPSLHRPVYPPAGNFIFVSLSLLTEFQKSCPTKYSQFQIC